MVSGVRFDNVIVALLISTGVTPSGFTGEVLSTYCQLVLVAAATKETSALFSVTVFKARAVGVNR